MELFRIDRVSENPNGQILWREEQEQYIVENYLKGCSIKKLSKIFNVHTNSIKKVLQKKDIHIRDLRESLQNNRINHNIFENIDTSEKAYWLGFLAADGNVCGDKICCSLQFNDYKHLHKLARFLGEDESKIRITNINQFQYASLSVFSIKCVEDLKKNGVVENKSLILKPPLFLEDDELAFAWIRGYFDGDGGLSFSKTQRRVQFYFTGTKEVLNWIVEKMQLHTEPFLEHNCSRIYRISCNGWLQAKEQLGKLYLNSTVYLDRKYNLFLKLFGPTEKEILMEKFRQEVYNWSISNRQIILKCKFNNVSGTLSDLFEIGKKYNLMDRRSVARNICGTDSTKDMLKYLQSVLQQ